MQAGHILNTRPLDRAGALSQALRHAGYRVSELPLLDFEVCPLPIASQARLADVRAGDVVVVVSPMAAQLGLAWIAQHPHTNWQHVQWFAVGEATAQVLAQAGFWAKIPARANSEGLLVLPEISQLQPPTRVMVWRGEGGRELIQDTLLQRGVELHSIAFYRRILPTQSMTQWRAWSEVDRPQYVLMTSGEAWENWCQMVGSYALQPTFLVYGEHLQRRLSSHVQTICLSSLQPQAVVEALANTQRAGVWGAS